MAAGMAVMKKACAVILLGLLMAPPPGGAQQPLERCLGDVCLMQPSGAYERLIGQGARVLPASSPWHGQRALCLHDGHVSYLFVYAGDGALASAPLGMIGVTRQRLCDGDTDSVPASWRAQTQALLGVGQQTLLAVRGQPSFRADMRRQEKARPAYARTFSAAAFGDQCWTYAQEPQDKTLLVNRYCFDAARQTRTVWLSDMP